MSGCSASEQYKGMVVLVIAVFMGRSQQLATKINHSARTGGSPLSHSGRFIHCEDQTYPADSSQAGLGPWVPPSNPLPFFLEKASYSLSPMLWDISCTCHCACAGLLELGAIMSTMAIQCIPSKRNKKVVPHAK